MSEIPFKNELEFIDATLACPGIYVGSNRLDYLQALWLGWTIGRDCVESAVWNTSLHDWCFRREGVALRGPLELNGLSLFYRCYGVRETALRQFRIYHKACRTESSIYQTPDSLPKSIGLQLHEYPYCEGAVPSAGALTDALARLTAAMFPEPVPNRILYLYTDAFIIHLRFFWRKASGALGDGLSFSERTESFTQMLALYAAVYRLLPEDYWEHTLTLRMTENRVESIWRKGPQGHNGEKWPEPDAFPEKDCLAARFEKWLKEHRHDI